MESFSNHGGILTLMQTKKSKKIPIILVVDSFWSGLMDWLDTLFAHNIIIPEDIVNHIFCFYENRGFEPSAEKQELMLTL